MALRVGTKTCNISIETVTIQGQLDPRTNRRTDTTKRWLQKSASDA